MPRPVLIACLLLYMISPIDLIPDVIPVLGWLDDIGVLVWIIHLILTWGKTKQPQEARPSKPSTITREAEVLAVRDEPKA